MKEMIHFAPANFIGKVEDIGISPALIPENTPGVVQDRPSRGR